LGPSFKYVGIDVFLALDFFIKCLGTSYQYAGIDMVLRRYAHIWRVLMAFICRNM